MRAKAGDIVETCEEHGWVMIEITHVATRSLYLPPGTLHGDVLRSGSECWEPGDTITIDRRDIDRVWQETTR